MKPVENSCDLAQELELSQTNPQNASWQLLDPNHYLWQASLFAGDHSIHLLHM